MANTTVEILGGQLDGAILENAASEQTLKELVAAISGSSSRGASSSSGLGSIAGRTPAGMIAGGVVRGISSAVKGAVNQLGNVVGTAGAFTGMLLKGEGNLSSYTKTLNQQVIGQLPLVGRYLGAVGGAISGTIEEFEKWNRTLQSLTSSGATFNNSIIQLMHASVRSYMSLDEFASLIGQNSKTLRSLGSTVTQGAEAFSEYSYAVLNASGPARKTLINMGYTIPQINNQLMSFLDLNYRGTRKDQISQTQLAESFVGYQKHIHQLTTLTGKRADQLEQEMRTAQNDAAFQLQLNRLPVDARTQMNTALASITAIYGEGAAEMFKARFLNLGAMNDNMAMLNMMFPNLMSQIDGAISNARQTGLTTAQQQKQQEDLMVSLIRSGANGFREYERLINAGRLGATDLQGVVSASAGIAQTLANMGVNIDSLTDDQIREFVQAQMAEQNDRETFTSILRQFGALMGDFRASFFGVLLKPNGPLDSFSKMMEEQQLGEKIRQFGISMGTFVRDSLPAVVDFFAGFGTQSGRDLYREHIGKFLDTVGAYFLHYIPKLFGMEINDADLQANLQRIDSERNPNIARLTVQRDAEVSALLTQPYRGPGANQDALAGGDLSAGTGELSARQAMAVKLYRAFRAAGMPEDVARAMVGEVNRENALNPDLIFGTHIDPANHAVNAGMISWQGERGRAFFDYMRNLGFIDDNNRMVRSDAALQAQANFMMNEIVNTSAYQATEDLMNDPQRTFDSIHRILGDNYIRWRRTDPAYSAGGQRNIRNGYSTLDSGLSRLLVPEMRGGSLGTYGSLFANMGGGTNAELHNEEAVLSPSELTGEMVASAEDSYAGVNQLNNNLQQLIALQAQRLEITERLAVAMANKSNKLFA